MAKGSDSPSPNDIENQNQSLDLVISMEKELSSLRSLSSACCIYKVPTRLRCLNEKSYEPEVVSIGPLHHGKEAFKDMEEQKWRCLKHFIQKTRVDLHEYINLVKERENEVRNCYAEFITFSNDAFVKLILLDAVFIIEVIMRILRTEFKDDIDRITDQPRNLESIFRDLVLLENQIPFFIINDIYVLAQMNGFVFRPFPEFSIDILLILFFQPYVSFARIYIEPKDIYNSQIQFHHILDLKRKFDIPLELQDRRRGNLKSLNIPTITQLHQAGVKLKVISQKKLFEIRFEVDKGILEIPKLFIDDTTEIHVRNTIAYEQCHCTIESYYMTDYFTLMKGLVMNPKDYELLIKYGIIESTGEIRKVVTFFQTIGIGTVVFPNHFYFATLCEEMDDYCKSSMNQWKTNLKQNYCNTPWTIISVIAAAIILILTFIQTICSLLSLKGSH